MVAEGYRRDRARALSARGVASHTWPATSGTRLQASASIQLRPRRGELGGRGGQQRQLRRAGNQAVGGAREHRRGANPAHWAILRHALPDRR